MFCRRNRASKPGLGPPETCFPRRISTLSWSDPKARFPRKRAHPTLRTAADLVDRVVREGYDVQVAVRPLLDARRDAESPADQQRFALGRVEFLRAEQVIRHLVRKTRIGTDIDVQAVGCQPDPVQAAAGSADLL